MAQTLLLLLQIIIISYYSTIKTNYYSIIAVLVLRFMGREILTKEVLYEFDGAPYFITLLLAIVYFL